MNRQALSAVLGLVLVAATATLARADELFLRIAGLAGDASLASSTTNPAYQGWMRAVAVSGAHGLLQPGATTRTFERLTVTRAHDPSSTFFLGAALAGKGIDSASIEIRAFGGSLPLTRLNMKGVFVRKVTTTYSTGEWPLDVIELEFGGIEWIHQAPPSSGIPGPVYRLSSGKI